MDCSYIKQKFKSHYIYYRLANTEIVALNSCTNSVSRIKYSPQIENSYLYASSKEEFEEAYGIIQDRIKI